MHDFLHFLLIALSKIDKLVMAGKFQNSFPSYNKEKRFYTSQMKKQTVFIPQLYPLLIWVVVEASRVDKSILGVQHVGSKEIKTWIIWPKQLLELPCSMA